MSRYLTSVLLGLLSMALIFAAGYVWRDHQLMAVALIGVNVPVVGCGMAVRRQIGEL